MKILETDPRLPSWLNDFLNSWPLCLDEDTMRVVLCVCYDNQGWWMPPNGSLFYNGYFFFRIMWPLGAGLGIGWKWEGVYYALHIYAGWKGNGRFALTFRAQSQQESEIGVLGKNLGHAKGFDRGTA